MQFHPGARCTLAPILARVSHFPARPAKSATHPLPRLPSSSDEIDHRGNAIERTLGSLPSTDRISSPTTIRYGTSIVALTIIALASEADSRTENGRMIREEEGGGGAGGIGSTKSERRSVERVNNR